MDAGVIGENYLRSMVRLMWSETMPKRIKAGNVKLKRA